MFHRWGQSCMTEHRARTSPVARLPAHPHQLSRDSRDRRMPAMPQPSTSWLPYAARHGVAALGCRAPAAAMASQRPIKPVYSKVKVRPSSRTTIEVRVVRNPRHDRLFHGGTPTGDVELRAATASSDESNDLGLQRSPPAPTSRAPRA